MSHNMEDYDRKYENFNWSEIYDQADWDAPEELNVAHETCDRHVDGGDNTALVHVDEEMETTHLS